MRSLGCTTTPTTTCTAGSLYILLWWLLHSIDLFHSPIWPIKVTYYCLPACLHTPLTALPIPLLCTFSCLWWCFSQRVLLPVAVFRVSNLVVCHCWVSERQFLPPQASWIRWIRSESGSKDRTTLYLSVTGDIICWTLIEHYWPTGLTFYGIPYMKIA